MKPTYNVLILGASYGSLFGTKLLLAGHSVTLVCTPPTAELINREGTLVRFPIRGRDTLVEIHSSTLTGQLSASAPEGVEPTEFDLVVLGMQESQYSSEGVREMMARIAAAHLPSLAIMNMPPLPYLARIPGLATDQLQGCFVEPSVWDGFDPGLVSLASPDPQAFRPPEEPKNVLQVGLPTNFKAAHFESEEHTRILRDLQADIEASLYDPGDGAIEIPVKLKVHDSIFVPLAKWPMLLAGNYRCIQRDGMISIREAVHGDIEMAKDAYGWAGKLCTNLGAAETDLVPFEKYARAAEGLAKPSSAARALFSGAKYIERVDCLIQRIANQQGLQSDTVDNIVALVDERLGKNRAVTA
ncbi:MAG: hypothetical protein MK279_07255 [Gemmatimonadetes bacterium]|nr:hypothetical protein [Gemmatimonadota bacterium]GIT51892.1 MAG: hypothetical protein Ct9H300mP15_21050 [Gemmatimonadota bacterium]